MEIEAKFSLANPQDLAFWTKTQANFSKLASWQVQPASVRELKMFSHYFDTVQGDLAAAHISLRLREENQQIWLNLKAPTQTEEGAISLRQEWECELLSRNIDDLKSEILVKIAELSREDKALLPIAKLLKGKTLESQGTVTFTRKLCLLENPLSGALLEWSLDVGEFAWQEQRSPLAEMEVEIKKGKLADLEDCLHALATLRPLKSESLSKRARLAVLSAHHAAHDYDLIIVGAGASGLAAALYLVSKKFPRLLILEAGKSLGRKIRASGNGRCNLSNAQLKQSDYFSQRLDLLPALLKGSKAEMKKFSELLGLPLFSDEEGRIYPLACEAKAVSELLQVRLAEAGVEIRYEEEVERLDCLADSVEVYCQSGLKLRAKQVILACGSAAYPQLGGSFSAARLAQDLDLKFWDFRPGLAKLLLREEKFLKKAQGTRVRAEASLEEGMRLQGEFLFNAPYLSGIAAMDLANYLSRRPGTWRKQRGEEAYYLAEPAKLSLDLLPSLAQPTLAKMLREKAKIYHKPQLTTLLAGFLAARLNQTIMSQVPNFTASAKDIAQLSYLLKNYPLTIEALSSFKEAQAAAGGLDLSEVDRSFCLKKYPRLYMVGEALDVLGRCGGFNLHFAITSGLRAGEAAYRKLSN